MTTLDTVRRLIGRRSKISRQQMADILSALQADGLDLRNGYMRGTVVYDGPDGDTGTATDQQHHGAARAWANACAGITCISVDGYVRYDEPGSMTYDRRELIFAPAHLATLEYDQVGQLRRRADRVLVVRDDPALSEAPAAAIRRKVADWVQARNECDETLIHSTDSRYAHRLGLAVLSALCQLRADLERARGPMSGREVIAHLAPIIHLATGEAQDRLRALAEDESIEIPGIVAHRFATDDEEG